MKRTNVMLDDEQHRKLKSYAKKEGATLGRLVRDALDVVYERKDALEKRKQVAMSAYQEGFISLGKLAEVLGLDPVSARKYLKEHSIPVLSQNRTEAGRDSGNA
ncbi:MAG: UPF0175 family protein [Candidatus Aminicenantales bacterium]